eukprot:4273139-Pyramimonas_sp.AAC.1
MAGSTLWGGADGTPGCTMPGGGALGGGHAGSSGAPPPPPASVPLAGPPSSVRPASWARRASTSACCP